MSAMPKILLVDDEALVRDELGGLLEDEGYEVTTAADGAEGLHLFQSARPDMVITDVRMPQRDGLSLALQIKHDAPSTPITVITGHGNYAMAVQALRAGVTDFIRKPVRFEDLQTALLRMEAALRPPDFRPTDLPSSVTLLKRAWDYRLCNDVTAIAPFVDATLGTAAPDAPRERLTELSLALRELLTNAIEHGNLGITYQEKSTALERGDLAGLITERAAQPPYADRQVEVSVVRVRETLMTTIADGGRGFDWRALPDPTDPNYLLAEHGRGVLLARMSVDELNYNQVGNVVSVKKRLDGSGSSA